MNQETVWADLSQLPDWVTAAATAAPSYEYHPLTNKRLALQQFGDIIALKFAGYRPIPGQSAKAIYLCYCKKTEKLGIMLAANLLNKHSRSMDCKNMRDTIPDSKRSKILGVGYLSWRKGWQASIQCQGIYILRNRNGRGKYKDRCYFSTRKAAENAILNFHKQYSGWPARTALLDYYAKAARNTTSFSFMNTCHHYLAKLSAMQDGYMISSEHGNTNRRKVLQEPTNQI